MMKHQKPLGNTADSPSHVNCRVPNMGEVAANLMLTTSQNPDAWGKADDSLTTTGQ